MLILVNKHCEVLVSCSDILSWNYMETLCKLQKLLSGYLKGSRCMHIFKLMGDRKGMLTDRKFKLYVSLRPETFIYQHRKGMEKDRMFFA